MPSKYSIKPHIAEGYYHVFARGVEKRPIFMEDKDYQVFITYLKDCLVPKDENRLRSIMLDSKNHYRKRNTAARKLRLKNHASDIKLFAYCLMKNHFHLLVQQRESEGMQEFMKSLLTRYSMYFNRKYKRTGKLFEGTYKAVLVQTDIQLLELSRYIHRNPIGFVKENELQTYPYSSYRNYGQEGYQADPFVNTRLISQFFSKRFPNLSYESFVQDKEDLEQIAPLLLD